MPVKVQTEDFNIGEEINLLRQGNPGIGAIATFTGLVRDSNLQTNIVSMELEHYPGMTEKVLEEIIEQAKVRWNINDALIIHRYGVLKPLDQIVLVAVTGTHRGDAFSACEFLMDFLKTKAPFWKKEITDDGSHWVDMRESDAIAVERWSRKSI